ncbi:MAG: PilX N-terminal domain-containing pilus assembly protein [Xanthomonadales bacterium]|nr:PilX N-terminal domain-containing pilus assembly protein [Xanthomonadales bacterium]
MIALQSLRNSQGSVLIIGLILLLVLTIIGLAGMQNTALQERMAGNFDERNDAFQYAELALRVAEREHAEGAASGAAILNDGSDGWPAACPEIDQLGCGGSNATASTACLEALSWQTVNLGADVDAEASFSVVPVDNMQCGAAASQG